MEPKCGFCGSTEYKGLTRSRGGVLIICSSCGAILAAVKTDN